MANVIEALGFGLILAFLYAVWSPLALLGAGVLLVLYANTRSGSGGRMGAAFGAATASFRDAYRAPPGAHRRDRIRSVA